MSLLRLSLVFYACLMLIILVGAGILYGVLDALGLVDSLEDLLTGLGFGGQEGFRFSLAGIYRTLFLIGVVSVILWSALTVFVAFLYNLIADLVGGIELTLSERR